MIIGGSAMLCAGGCSVSRWVAISASQGGAADVMVDGSPVGSAGRNRPSIQKLVWGSESAEHTIRVTSRATNYGWAEKTLTQADAKGWRDGISQETPHEEFLEPLQLRSTVPLEVTGHIEGGKDDSLKWRIDGEPNPGDVTFTRRQQGDGKPASWKAPSLTVIKEYYKPKSIIVNSDQVDEVWSENENDVELKYNQSGVDVFVELSGIKRNVPIDVTPRSTTVTVKDAKGSRLQRTDGQIELTWTDDAETAMIELSKEDFFSEKIKLHRSRAQNRKSELEVKQSLTKQFERPTLKLNIEMAERIGAWVDLVDINTKKLESDRITVLLDSKPLSGDWEVKEDDPNTVDVDESELVFTTELLFVRKARRDRKYGDRALEILVSDHYPYQSGIGAKKATALKPHRVETPWRGDISYSAVLGPKNTIPVNIGFTPVTAMQTIGHHIDWSGDGADVVSKDYWINLRDTEYRDWSLILALGEGRREDLIVGRMAIRPNPDGSRDAATEVAYNYRPHDTKGASPSDSTRVSVGVIKDAAGESPVTADFRNKEAIGPWYSSDGEKIYAVSRSHPTPNYGYQPKHRNADMTADALKAVFPLYGAQPHVAEFSEGGNGGRVCTEVKWGPAKVSTNKGIAYYEPGSVGKVELATQRENGNHWGPALWEDRGGSGFWVAYKARHGVYGDMYTIWVENDLGESHEITDEKPMRSIDGMCWGPKGEYLIYAGVEKNAPRDGVTQDYDCSLWAVRLRTGEHRQLTTWTGYEGFPQMNEEGDKIYFISNATAVDAADSDSPPWTHWGIYRIDWEPE